MATIEIHDEAAADLLGIAEADPVAAAQLAVIVEQLEHDADLLDRLTQHGFGRRGRDEFSVSRWVEQWRPPDARDLWRLKFFDFKITSYRMLYATIPEDEMRHVVLAFVHRDGFDYEADHPVTRRVQQAYEQLRDA